MNDTDTLIDRYYIAILDAVSLGSRLDKSLLEILHDIMDAQQFMFNPRKGS